jgi:SAM-dependent methyltransferase
MWQSVGAPPPPLNAGRSALPQENTMSQQEQWQLSGNAAELFERYMVPAIFGPWGADLVTRAAPQPVARVLDVACGTGVIARLAAPQVGVAGQVRGLDINAEALAVARSLPPPPGASITWHEGSAVAMPFADATFDLVLCQQGLQFFPDRPAALREMHRVLAPGGRVTLSVWRAIQHSPAYAVLADALERHGFAEVAASRRAPFVLGSAEEIRALLAEAGFQHVTMHLAVKMARFASPELFVRLQTTASVTAPTSVFARVSEEARRALIRDVSTALRSYVDDAGLAFPMAAHVAVARS